jgi:hypothetical protein
LSDRQQPTFCEATFCGRATDGRFMCDTHAPLMDSDQIARTRAINHIGILFRADSESLRLQLEVLAQAVETVDRRARIAGPPINQYRKRLQQLAANDPPQATPAVQARLIEELPSYAGPYGPRRDRA